MKKILTTTILSLLLISAYTQTKVIPNPASLYVKFLGYKSETRIDSQGNQKRVCVFPDNTECEEWSFFRGVCGQKFSYCALKGCGTESFVDTIAHTEYAVCVCSDSLGNKIKVPLLDFMKQHGDELFKEDKTKTGRK